MVVMQEAARVVAHRRNQDPEVLRSAWADPQYHELFAGLARQFERQWTTAERGAARRRAEGVARRAQDSGPLRE